MGRYGNTKVINLTIGMELLGRVLAEIDKIQEILNYKPNFF